MENRMKRRHGAGRLLALLLALALALPMGFSGIAGAQSAVAETGGVLYATLGEAVSAAQDGGTIRLLSDVTIDGSVETGVLSRPDADIILDLGGFTVSGGQSGPLLTVDGGGWTLHNGILDNSAADEPCVQVRGGQDGSVSVPAGAQSPDWNASSLTLVPGYPVTVQSEGFGQVFYGDSGLPLASGETLFLAGGGAVHVFLFQAEPGFTVKQILRNDAALAPAGQLSISDLDGPTTLSVTFDVQTFLLAPQGYVGEKENDYGAVVTPGSAIVAYGEDVHFDFTVNEGYRLLDVQVDGVSLGPVTSFDVTDVRELRDIRILLEKTAFFIMLDAGHFAWYNHSPAVLDYYEGNEMWIFHKYLKEELEKYPDVIVKTTRADNSKTLGLAMGPFDRGAAGAGCDLVLSLHSNATSQESVNHVVGIYTLHPALTKVSKGLGDTLTATVSKVMGITQAPKVYTRAQSDGRDWYGVNRGASSVGVPSLILEHSFHTNKYAANWLLSDSHKRTLAVAEARTLAAYFGIGQGGVITNPGTPGGYLAYGYSYNSSMVKWNASDGATGYQIYRATSAGGTYVLVKDTTALSYVDTGLTCGKDYFYKMRAYKVSAEGTKYSRFTTVDPARPLPAKPTVSLVPGDNKMTVKWNRVAGATGYVIYRAVGTSTSYTRVKVLTSGELVSWTQTGLKDKYAYKYKVRAYRTSGGVNWYSVPSAAASAKTR